MNIDMKWYQKLYKVFESCYLCIRFPFLYPRNRFTGRHRVNVLHKLLYNLYNNSIQVISITGKLEKVGDGVYSGNVYWDSTEVCLYKSYRKLILSNYIDTKEYNLNKILWNDNNKFEILGLTSVKTFNNNIVITVHVKTSDKTDQTNYGFRFDKIELIKNKFKYFLYKTLNWIDREILDRILFIPTYTELDAMPEGWRKAFGIQMCEDIKKQLKKDHYLYKYRITQIKEKFGTLRWYDEGSSKEIYDIIQKYEDLSWNTCIECGKPSTKISDGWITPYCNDCFPKSSVIYQEKINNIWVHAKDKEEI